MADGGRVAVFRCDASPFIGAGHVMRCTALADALTSERWSCVFVVGEASAATVPQLAGFPSVALSRAEAEHPASLLRARPQGCDLLVVDSYEIGVGYEKEAREWATNILVIDDLADRYHDCDLLLDSAHGRRREDYVGKVPAACRFMLGPHYALLRRQFSQRRSQALARRVAAGQAERLLVNVGGTDPLNVTGAILRIIEAMQLQISVDVVLGGNAPHLDTVRDQIKVTGSDVRLQVDVEDMADLMTQADLAIGAAGGASWERCCLGLPSLLLVTADNQRDVATALHRAGAAKLVTVDRLAGELEALLWAPEGRRNMAIHAALLCDGLGARRAVSAISPVLACDGAAVTLRPALLSDAELMLLWQSFPGTRAFARNTRIPTRSEHERWLATTLGDPQRLLMVIVHGDESAGVVRVDGVNERGHREVSIYLAPERYRLGIGVAALKQLRRLLPDTTLDAEIDPSNVASIRLFQSAGYEYSSDGYYLSEPTADASRAAACH